jgi:hypothetical protein
MARFEIQGWVVYGMALLRDKKLWGDNVPFSCAASLALRARSSLAGASEACRTMPTWKRVSDVMDEHMDKKAYGDVRQLYITQTETTTVATSAPAETRAQLIQT